MIAVGTFNAHRCVGGDGVRDPHRILGVVAEMGCDIVALQEIDTRFWRRRAVLDRGAVPRRCGLEVAAPAPAPEGQIGWYGNALLVRTQTVRVAAARAIALPGAEPRGALVADLETAVGPLRVVAAHLSLLPGDRRRQARRLLGEVAAARHGRCLLMGDLNEWVARAEPVLADALPERGAARSFPARRPMLCLDRIWAGPGLRLRGVRAHDSPLARCASDHLPLLGRIALRHGEEDGRRGVGAEALRRR